MGCIRRGRQNSKVAAQTRQFDLGFANPSIFDGTRWEIVAGDPSTERLIGPGLDYGPIVGLYYSGSNDV